MTSSPLGPVHGPGFRRQFVLGPTSADLLRDWVRHPVTARHMLTVHPDLPCTRVDLGGRSLILLGYLLDPRHSGRDDRAIMTDVLQHTHSAHTVLTSFDPLAGRWVALYICDGRVRIFHDAGGLRQVYFGRDKNADTWCGSRPEVLARVTGAAPDLSTMDSLRRDGVFRPATHFWPGSGSAFAGIQRLLPNHYLDLETSRVTRYWPTAPIADMSPERAIERSAASLTGVISAASRRFPLALALTAGYDSRLLLAASRSHVQEMAFYTLRRPATRRRHADLYLPRKILRDQGLARKLIPVEPVTGGAVAKAIEESFTLHHQAAINHATALQSNPPLSGGWVTVNGNVAEVARCAYPRVEVTPENLARSTGAGASRFAQEQFGAWYASAEPAIRHSNINAWDLFYWEQAIGGWLATLRSEFDAVEEGVSPYNSRAFLECLLGVDESLRSAPSYTLHRQLIAHLWPQLLQYPINPPGRREQLKRMFSPRTLR